MAAKSFSVTTRDNNGVDTTVEIMAERAEQSDGGQLRLFTGEDQVGSFISVVRWFDTTAVQS